MSLGLFFLGCRTGSGHRRSPWIAAAAALSLSELPLQWVVLWKILSGGDVQGHSLSPPHLLLYFYASRSLSCLPRLSAFPLMLFTRLLVMCSRFSPSAFLLACIFLNDRCRVAFKLQFAVRPEQTLFQSGELWGARLGSGTFFFRWVFSALLLSER